MMNLLNILIQADSTAIADSLTSVQAGIAAVVEKVANTPTEELISDLIDKSVAFGLKVIAALIIYFLGAWIIRKIKGILGRIFERKVQMPQ